MRQRISIIILAICFCLSMGIFAACEKGGTEEKGKYDMSEVAWNYPADGYVYDGSEKTVALTGLPSGVTATYSGDVTESEEGNYTACDAGEQSDNQRNGNAVPERSYLNGDWERQCYHARGRRRIYPV